ncbi:3-carboxy-cis,cis-muconate cycloisomerase [Rubrobacter radiotolerans]|uniref:3-carboxy-cis,cis-muconate cycloisomerase n=1 Tax=Rubrobacter radiotolerans TaxID=42256 RepID=A0A023X294_RUBRA|nr:3-carboxy-cis,cis-muconate cycloisomerase [Rubrobacter radiotolerans]AHY46346.1 3-carboxy-cis,cis-muconate cycloisomerase [Rubrobacter radiotolerans]MDX5893753.1 3-carboxy-cis,cis-muconate cycloisomerase [Rubrobacter radiotolerans]SMC04430.1 3-carboxy-cis,cis-muconate cycloisomerase [Rubrobacter radiotolerans DSM 5868]
MEELFRPVFVSDRLREATGGRAWLRAMLEAEAALAAAQVRAGVIPAEAARAIARACDPDRYSPETLGREGRAAGNPVPPLVRALTAAVDKDSEEAARYVHKGATSQDILDTAAMLVIRGALDLILTETDLVAAACARLAREHRDTPMAARTLMQQALPTTFGLKAAGWLVSVLKARRALRRFRRSGLAAQLGGAAGTLASLGDDGLAVAREFARELDLPEPALPWHTDRTRLALLAGAISTLAGVLGKVALDVVLMAQTEVGEVAEPAGEGRGGSSTLPHKRNPVLSVTARASARRAQDLAHTVQTAMAAEHERAAGVWHSEWEPLSEALALVGGAAENVREVLEGLEVYPERMRKNLDATEGLILTERVTTLAAGKLGRLRAHDLVKTAAARVAKGGGSLKEELLSEPELAEVLSEGEVDAALDPAGYLGSAGAFVDRALELYGKEDA